MDLILLFVFVIFSEPSGGRSLDDLTLGWRVSGWKVHVQTYGGASLIIRQLSVSTSREDEIRRFVDRTDEWERG